MRVLSACQAGTVRSGALTLACKNAGIPDALQCGVVSNSPDTLALLADWADRILVAEAGFAASFPQRVQSKVIDAGLGPDVWGNPLNPDLAARAAQIVQERLR